jgi:transcriptional regulator with XRE-family HTH domain
MTERTSVPVRTAKEIEAAHQELQWVIGDDIRTIRRRLGWSMSELAERMGVSKGFLTQVEAGTRNVSVAYLATVYEAMGYRLTFNAEPLPSTTEPSNGAGVS